MNIAEYIKIKKPCECSSKIIFFKKEYKTRVWAKNWRDNYIQLVTGTSNFRKEKRYIARCEKCNKFYFATTTKKKMIEYLNYIEIPYYEILL